MTKSKKEFGNIPIATISILQNNPIDVRDIIFIHMSWGGTWAFSYYLKFFAEHSYNVYALDLRGHGKSGGTVSGATM